MTPQEHYAEAERLLAAGVEVVGKIRTLSEERQPLLDLEVYTGDVWDRLENLTARMDERGKQAMGIWAQAQVHATLANAPVRSVVQHDNSMAGSHPWWTEVRR